VAVNSGSVSLPIQCFRVSVKQGDEKCTIMSQALPSFFLQSSPIKENQCVYMHLQNVLLSAGLFAVEGVTSLLHCKQLCRSLCSAQSGDRKCYTDLICCVCVCSSNFFIAFSV
jgi:hypothetical protein